MFSSVSSSVLPPLANASPTCQCCFQKTVSSVQCSGFDSCRFRGRSLYHTICNSQVLIENNNGNRLGVERSAECPLLHGNFAPLMSTAAASFLLVLAIITQGGGWGRWKDKSPISAPIEISEWGCNTGSSRTVVWWTIQLNSPPRYLRF